MAGETSASKEAQLDAVEPLCDQDIISKCADHGLKIRFIRYEQLPEVQQLEQIMPCILLYELHVPLGHWTCLWVNSEGVNLFDPLGKPPDGIIDHFEGDRQRRHQAGCDFTYLTALLADYCDRNKCHCIWNEKPMQSMHTATCGYFCCVRLLCGEVTNKQFDSMWMRKFPKSIDRELAMVAFYKKL